MIAPEVFFSDLKPNEMIISYYSMFNVKFNQNIIQKAPKECGQHRKYTNRLKVSYLVTLTRHVNWDNLETEKLGSNYSTGEIRGFDYLNEMLTAGSRIYFSP